MKRIEHIRKGSRTIIVEAIHPKASPIYLDLRRQASNALRATNYAVAGKLFEWAQVEARRINDPVLVDQAYCNVALPAIVTNSGSRFADGLRRLVAYSPEASTRFQAAHALTLMMQTEKAPSKALFYAHLSHQNALGQDCPSKKAIGSYTLGVRLLVAGQPLAARLHFEGALELGADVWPLEARAMAGSTYGYCLQRLGESSRALAILQDNVDRFSGLSQPVFENRARLNLGFSLLDMEEVEMALDQASTLLDSWSTANQRKNALFLAGEANAYLGLPDAREYFVAMQREFYPHQPELVDFLQHVRTHRLVDWFA